MTKKKLESLDGKEIRIEWLEDVELEVVESVDKKDNIKSSMETFLKGTTIDVDVYGIDEKPQTVDVQFGDGSVVTRLPTKVFKVKEIL